MRVALTGAGLGGVFCHAATHKALAKDVSAAPIAGHTNPPDDLKSDIHGSAEYRSPPTGMMAKRAVGKAAAR